MNASTDRSRTTADFVRRLLEQEPALAYRDGMSPEQRTTWRDDVVARLKIVLDFPDIPPQPKPVLLADEPRDGYSLQSWEIFPEPGLAITVLVLVPDSANHQPAPLVLCLPGSSQPKEALAGEPWNPAWKNRFGEHNFMALHMVRAGYVAVAMDTPGMNALADADYPDWKRQAEHLIWLDRPYEAMTTFHAHRTLQEMRRLPAVDADQLAVCGHSLGAKPALMLGLLEPAVRAIVWNDHASDWREQILHTKLQPLPPWHYIPGFIRSFDYTDLMCALAPTPLLITEGGRPPTHRKIRSAYESISADDALTIDFMPNFQDPAARTDGEMPFGLTAEAYAVYGNYDGDHYFKDGVAMPWLAEKLPCIDNAACGP